MKLKDFKWLNPDKILPKHIAIKLLKMKDKERILRASREKILTTHTELQLMCLLMEK